ncbi:MAG: ribonuclease HII [Oscillospiraceae bacterium]|nr:ribonuclease HII [Oscillospiraceae bacterium]
MTLFEFDRQFDSESSVIVGIDEAGRGPLAGDVYAAAVVFDKDTVIEGINDSKKLSAKKRDILFDVIKDRALKYSIATASVEEIEEINILEAAMLAMRRAYEGLGISSDNVVALIDGNRSPNLPCMCKTVVHGDALSQSIAAASILAKVQRDRYMAELAEKYPEYQFEKHKGYGTKLHYEMIKKYGISPVHRKSFLKNLSEK